MRLTRTRIVLLALLGAVLGGGAFAYFKYRSVSAYLIGQINSQAGKKLGRQVRFRNISFSPLRGVVVDEPCVSRRPDFTKGDFFCARRAVIRPEIPKLLKNRLYFANVEFEKPVIKVREAGGKWDFEDLLDLLPKTSQGLHITWNAKRLALRGATVQVDMASTGRSLSLENADLTLTHYSALAGNYGLDFKGAAKTVLNGQLLGADAALKTELNFEYAGLASSVGSFSLENASLGASTLKKAALKWELFSVNKPAAEKNYRAGFRAEGLFIPAQSGGAAKGLKAALDLLSKVMGRETPAVEDIEVSRLETDLELHDAAVRVKKLELDSNFMELRSRYELDGRARAVDADFSAKLGGNKLALTAKGPMNGPEIQPAMSYLLNQKLLEAVRALNAALLKAFPVVTEKPNA